MWKLAMGAQAFSSIPTKFLRHAKKKKFTVCLAAGSHYLVLVGSQEQWQELVWFSGLCYCRCAVWVKCQTAFSIHMLHPHGSALLIAVVREASVRELTQSPRTSPSCGFSDCPALTLKSIIVPSQTQDHGRKVGGGKDVKAGGWEEAL